MTGFLKPFETWSLDGSTCWRSSSGRPTIAPETLTYFCNTLPTVGLPDRDDRDFPKREHEQSP